MYIPEESNNVNVMYPLVSSTIPTWLCALIAYVPTVIVIVLIAIRKKSLLVLVLCLLCLLCSAVSCLAITGMGKIFAGRPRPHFYERIEDNSQINDAYKSFPSGHSSTIFNGMTFLSLLLAGQFKIFSTGMESWKIFSVILPLICAGAVAITRTRDYHHNFSDILAGSLIGIVFAVLLYCAKFKPLTSGESDELKIMDEVKRDNEIVDEEEIFN
ncbi:Phosphatidic acid phosphatase type 2 domain-containing protein 1B [Entamoeba marina]